MSIPQRPEILLGNKRLNLKRLIGAASALSLCIAFCGSAAAATAVARGKTLFQKTCANCHTTQVGLNKVGPSLAGIVGRPVASVQDYAYSEKMQSMRAEWKVWDEEHLDAYLTNPRQVLHGVKMFFAVPDAKDRGDVIAYLKTLK